MARPYKGHLRLIERQPQPKSADSYEFSMRGEEATLFSSQHPSLLLFLAQDELTGSQFITLLGRAQPTIVVDLRAAPRFDLDKLSRKEVFARFEALRTRYVDLPAAARALGLRYEPNVALSVSEAIEAVLFKSGRKHVGPFLLLCDRPQATSEFVQTVSDRLDPHRPAGWEVARLPEYLSTSRAGARKLIFISHATPEDSDFARWLAAQLQLSGYEVWVDLRELVAGETFWDEIEDAIRNRAAKFLVAISRQSQTKAGVLDELNVAISLERVRSEEFVIPLRIDDLPFHEFRANIARKNIVDFSHNWSRGLSRVLSALERDAVPKSAIDEGGQLLSSVLRRELRSDSLQPVPERLSINWLDIRAFPGAVYAYAVSAGAAAKFPATLGTPHVIVADTLICFVPPSEINSYVSPGLGARLVGGQETGAFISTREQLNSHVSPREHRKILANLLRQSWDAKSVAAGMKAYALASGSLAWFAPHNCVPNDKVVYLGADGVIRRKNLVGFSAKRNVYWHFALELRPDVGRAPHFVARPHVIFTEDGLTPLVSASKMHALRRGFCKSWWNDRWRDLTEAMLAWMSSDGEIALPAGGGAIVRVSSSMSCVESPVSPMASVLAASSDASYDLDEEEPSDADLDEEELELVAEPWVGGAVGPIPQS